jgi:hypothetical protein
MKKILLVDVDSKIPNIALGKLSTYHKSKGHKVDYLKLGLKGFSRNVRCRIVDASNYDSVFASNIFTNNQKKFRIINCADVWVAGVGSINSMVRLPPYIDKLDIDYSLWPDNDKSYGFITRGCIRKCKFCFVPRTEGKIYFDREIDRIVKHKVAIFLDNNILGFNNHRTILQELAEKKICCQFNQGLDIRLLDDENAEILSRINYYQKYIFAFDDIRYKKSVERGTKIFQKYVPGKWRMRFLVYYNPSEPLSDLIYRIEWSRKHYVLPYIMKDASCSSSLYRTFLMVYGGWTNSTGGQVCACSFPEYVNKECRDKERKAEVLNTFNKALKGEI